MTKPVTELDFPAVTICKGGQDMQAVRQALDRDKELWQENNRRRKRSADSGDYCMEHFGQSCGAVEGMVRALASPQVQYSLVFGAHFYLSLID